MTSADLLAWKKRLGLSNAQAARVLSLSVSGFRKQVYGEQAVSDQTARIAELVESAARRAEAS